MNSYIDYRDENGIRVAKFGNMAGMKIIDGLKGKWTTYGTQECRALTFPVIWAPDGGVSCRRHRPHIRVARHVPEVGSIRLS